MAKQQDNLYMAAAAHAANHHPGSMSTHHLHTMGGNRHSFESSSLNELSGEGRNMPPHHHHHHHLNHHHQANGLLVETNVNSNPFYNAFYATHHQALSPPTAHQLTQHSAAVIAAAAANVLTSQQSDLEIDPRELETFAERFKQRRIKLGVTQADVGQQLSKLKLPGVGSLSQSNFLVNFKLSVFRVFLNFLRDSDFDSDSN